MGLTLKYYVYLRLFLQLYMWGRRKKCYIIELHKYPENENFDIKEMKHPKYELP